VGLQNPPTEIVERVANEANNWLQADGRRLLAESHSPDEALAIQRHYTQDVVAHFAGEERTTSNYYQLEDAFLRAHQGSQR
jgi:hypothetical protein